MNALTWLRSFRQLPALSLLIVVAIVAIPASGDRALQATAIIVGIYAVVALPLGLLFGHGGVLSLAQGAFAAIGGYTAAIIGARTELSPYLTVFIAAAAAMVVAALIARPILGLSPLALVIATLALGKIVEEITAGAHDLTGGRVGLTGVMPLPGIGFEMGAYFAIWGFAVVLVLLFTNLTASSRGRSLNAVRHDPTLAKSVGVAVSRELSVVFVLAAGVSGVAGWFYVHYVGFIAPESLSFTFSTAVLLMVVVGGRRAVLGPVVGAVFYVMVRDYIPGAERLENVIFGLLLAGVLVCLPGGLASIPFRLMRVREDRRSRSTASSSSDTPAPVEVGQ